MKALYNYIFKRLSTAPAEEIKTLGTVLAPHSQASTTKNNSSASATKSASIESRKNSATPPTLSPPNKTPSFSKEYSVNDADNEVARIISKSTLNLSNVIATQVKHTSSEELIVHQELQSYLEDNKHAEVTFHFGDELTKVTISTDHERTEEAARQENHLPPVEFDKFLEKQVRTKKRSDQEKYIQEQIKSYAHPEVTFHHEDKHTKVTISTDNIRTDKLAHLENHLSPDEFIVHQEINGYVANNLLAREAKKAKLRLKEYKQFIADGGDVNTKHTDGSDCLLHEMNKKRLNVVKYLLKNGAKIEISHINAANALFDEDPSFHDALRKHMEDGLSATRPPKRPSVGSATPHQDQYHARNQAKTNQTERI